MKKPGRKKNIFKIIIGLVLLVISKYAFPWMKVLSLIKKELSSGYSALVIIVIVVCIAIIYIYKIYDKRKTQENQLDHDKEMLNIKMRAKNDKVFIKSLSVDYKLPLIKKRVDILKDNMYKDDDEITNDDKDNGDDINDAAIVFLNDYLNRKNGC